MSHRCQHCKTSFLPKQADERFCCRGCESVHHFINEAGFDAFYDFLEKPLLPILDRQTPQTDYRWLREASPLSKSEATDVSKTLILTLKGASCNACVWLIEKIFHQIDGAESISIRPRAERLEIRFVPNQFDPIVFANQLQKFGYSLEPRPESAPAVSKREERDAFFTALFLAILSLIAYGLENTISNTRIPFGLIYITLSTLMIAMSGITFCRDLKLKLRHRNFGPEMLVISGVIAAYLGSLFGGLLGIRALNQFHWMQCALLLFLVLRFRLLPTPPPARSRTTLRFHMIYGAICVFLALMAQAWGAILQKSPIDGFRAFCGVLMITGLVALAAEAFALKSKAR